MSGRTALSAASFVLLAGCGGASDEDEIRDIVKEGSSNPASICDRLTDAALSDLGGHDACVDLSRSQDNTDADVEIQSVAVDGDKATAKVHGKDGAQTIRFVKQDGEWRVNPG
ncbi:MAG: hypothetical protein ACJ762_08165 [Solirubrobacteraceae bacterium]